MKLWSSLFASFFLLANSVPAFAADSSCVVAAIEGRSERISVRQDDGSYVHVEFVGNGEAHVATSSVQVEPSEETPIFRSPMLAPLHVEPVVGQDLKVALQQADLGVEFLDTKGNRIVQIRPTHSKDAWKSLEIDSDATHVYGVGEYPRAGTADEPWLGKVARTDGEHGNIMSPFYGGVQTSTQFPVAYGVRQDGTAFAVFVDTPYKVDWDFTKPGTWKVSTWGDELRYYVLSGKDLKDVHAKYLALIGKSPVPPRSVFGVGVSKFGYRNWADVDHDIEEMREKGLPVGMVSLDLYWFGGDFIHNPDAGGAQFTKMGSLLPDEGNFPGFCSEGRRFEKPRHGRDAHFGKLRERESA